MLKNLYILFHLSYTSNIVFTKNKQQNICSGQQGKQNTSKDILGNNEKN